MRRSLLVGSGSSAVVCWFSKIHRQRFFAVLDSIHRQRLFAVLDSMRTKAGNFNFCL